MSFDLRGKVAVVTGGASGIGTGIVAALSNAGALVVIADRDDKQPRTVKIDLADEQSIVRGCAEIVAQYGTPWILVNNAGVQDREALLDATAAEWDRTMAINARGPFLMTREIGNAMVAKGEGGRIINIASNSVRAPMIVGLTSYASSKGAVVALSQTSAFELVEHGITVNTVMPGGVMTPGAMAAKGPPTKGPAALRRPPLGMCEPQDIGAAVLFFASPEARFVTNQIITVDAGFSLT
jgi:NAD(P)-dependent dehydrogenase (short-subunit alcohol dehydrogenase family)